MQPQTFAPVRPSFHRLAPWLAVLIGLPLCGLLILFSWCTLFPAAQKTWFGDTAMPLQGSRGQSVFLPKATLASACTRDASHCIDNVVLIYGRLDSGTWSAFSSLLHSLPALPTTVCFHSPGGSVATATQLAGWIIASNANTCLAERYFVKGYGSLQGTICHSACPLVLVTGNERSVLGDELKMLLHRPGVKLDFCFACWKASLSNMLAYYLWRDMLTLRNRPEDLAHLKFLDRALRTEFSQTEPLPPSEWSHYFLFTNKPEVSTQSI